VAIVEALGDVLRQPLDIPFLGLLGPLVVEARQHMLLVQSLQLLRLLGHVGQQIRHLVCDVGPARRQQIHLDDRVAVIVVVAAREKAATVRGLVGGEEHGGTGGGAEALSAGEVVATAILVPMGRVVSVGLPVGEIAVGRLVRNDGGCERARWDSGRLTGWSGLATWRTAREGIQLLSGSVASGQMVG
jgi:hypothetical protein